MKCWIVLVAACLALERGEAQTLVAPGVAGEGAISQTQRTIPADSGEFRFAVMADRTGGVRPGVFEAAIGKVNLLRPDFVMSVGDLITGMSEDETEVNRQWDELDGIVRGLDVPFFHVPGNHDISNPVMGGIWQRRLGRSYYHFRHKNALFLCLDTQNGTGKSGLLGPEQVAYARGVLASNAAARWTFVFLHQPLWRQSQTADLAGWKPVEEALHGRSATVFAGHNHVYEQVVRDGHDFIQLATTGGGSELAGPFYGEFDHVLWVTLTAQGPRYANLMLDGIAAKDVATPASLAYAYGVDEKIRIEAEPLTVGASLNGRMTTTVRLTNGTDLIQNLDGEWDPHPTLALAPASFRAVLAPGEAKVFEVGLTAAAPLPLEETVHPRIAWTQRMAPAGYGEVTRRLVTRTPFDTFYPCPRAARPVTVDGDLSDWPALVHRVASRDRVTYPENWTGPEDGSFAFATAYDDAFLYVAVRTTDDTLMVDRVPVPWGQDSLAVTLDVRDAKQRAAAPPALASQFVSHLLFNLSPSEKGSMIWYAKDKLPEGCRAVCVPAGQDMILELAVPLACLDAQQGGAWSDFQLNITFNDVDMNGTSPLRWRPAWYGGGTTYRGAGTFRKE